jgi:glycosyltransferase involved in cell wall biosynthesis
MRPLITVIIPCYNSSSTIERAVKSVLAQTYSNLEIILVDDASTDYELTLQKIKAFGEERIKYIRHDTNKNGSAARNTGIRNSTGKYIALLDADDEWFSGHLEHSFNKVQSEKNDRCIVYCRNLIKTNKYNDLILPAKEIMESETLGEYLFCNKGYMSTPSLFAPAEVFKDNLFDEKLVRHQDYDLLLRLESKGIRFLFSEHCGVVVHWENNDTEKKGGTWQFSLAFAKEHKAFFSSKAYSCFLLKNVVYSLFAKKQKLKGLKIFFEDCFPFKISPKEYLFFFDYLLFGKLTIIKLYSRSK